MVRLRRSALIRILTLLLLLWVGVDIGAHGLLASDFAPTPQHDSSIGEGHRDTGATAQLEHAHCFCHALSIGAVMHTLPARLASAGAVLPPLSSQVPRAAGHPFDHPPQLAA